MKKLITGMMILTLSSSLFAMPNKVIIDALTSKYPETMGTKLMDCMTCHTTDKWQRNAYGLDLQMYLRNMITTTGGTPEPKKYTKAFIMTGMKAVELADSDNDGFSNLEELVHVTKPGDATDHPERPLF